MTTLPPTPPKPGGGNIGSQPIATYQPSGKPKKASPIPLVVAAILILTSLAITIATNGKHSGVSIHILGYLATPLAVGICMGWDSIDQRNKTKADPWFIPKSKYSLMLRTLTAISFLAAFPHISEIAKYLSQSLADLLHQS
jgi:hypothetical protein